MSVTVVGSLNEDVLITVDRLPGRGETVIGSASATAAGGKGANQAAAAGRLGPGVHMVGRVGDDPAGARMQAALAECRVNVSRVHRTAGVPTGTATIPVESGSGENLIVVVPGANAALVPGDVDVPAVQRADVLLLQLEVPMETVTAAAGLAGGTVVLNPAPPAPLPAELLARVDVLVPNEHELAALAGVPDTERSPAEVAALARDLMKDLPAPHHSQARGGPLQGGRTAVVVTVGARGAVVVPADGGPALLQPPPPVTPVDTTGAGDCFCGALCQALSRGQALPEAVRYAATAAALSTTGAGARGALPANRDVQAALEKTPAAEPLT